MEILRQLITVEEDTKFVFTPHGEEADVSSINSLVAGRGELPTNNSFKRR